MCGIVGIVQKDNCFTDLYDSLIMLQHRGQDAAGMTICKNGKLSSRKAKGLVKEVFNQQHFERLTTELDMFVIQQQEETLKSMLSQCM